VFLAALGLARARCSFGSSEPTKEYPGEKDYYEFSQHHDSASAVYKFARQQSGTTLMLACQIHSRKSSWHCVNLLMRLLTSSAAAPGKQLFRIAAGPVRPRDISEMCRSHPNCFEEDDARPDCGSKFPPGKTWIPTGSLGSATGAGCERGAVSDCCTLVPRLGHNERGRTDS